MIDVENEFRCYATEVLFTWCDDKSAHIHSTRTDDILCIASSCIARRTVFPTRQHHTKHVATIVPDNDIHHGFRTIFCWRQRIVETTEQALAYVLTMTTNDIGCCRIVDNLPDTVVFLVLDDLHQITTQPLPSLLQGQDTTADGLKMGMVRGRRATMGPII